MSRSVIFLGPTLGQEAARSILDADYRPPAAHGDIYRLLAQGPPPAVIGLVDGYFQSVPAVRHKEILWALSRGVHVFGAASMGALRAVELADFGMVGVGDVFAAYRDGVIEDDDEVAVEHAPSAAGFTALCDPLVNIRATLRRARDEGVIGSGSHDRLIIAAKRMFYRHRTYRMLLQQAGAIGVSQPELVALEAWLPTGRVDQKRADAVAMLQRIREFSATNPAPFEPSFRFEEAEAWQIDMLEDEGSGLYAGPSGRSILDEVRLQPGEYDKLRREALTRVLALREIRREGIRLSEDEKRRAMRRLMVLFGFADLRRLEEWRVANDLDEGGFDRLMAGDAALARAMDIASPLVERELLDALRAAGKYAALRQRAARKDILTAERQPFAEHAHQSIPGFQLVLWFSSQILGGKPPDNVAEFAVELGFADLDAFYRALRREYEIRRGEYAADTTT